ncbi:YhcH/YjgK/YiaL family protein [Proteiniclasticum sp. BAD-10]|uniref:YhcH/YjgK/YiaL family protein n=1 Tax=Proteiniclasticum sediminis TaxID=2804028 RepID=A0A941HS96_9CLOT|nr:YhcH/YjgK/YiaL family protein [Proteiniclasticum sediminis]MBR0577468.1 YhcH/YjgK/YiaL family protein [Proteiniclasticum sediminis]
MMIIDKLQNIEKYEMLLPELALALEAMKPQLEQMEVGNYTFGNGYFMVQKGEAKPLDVGIFEAHRKFIDIQIVIQGSELLSWNELEDLTLVTPYHDAHDVAFYEGKEEHQMLITPGMFYAVFPTDGHKSVRTLEGIEHFAKIVVKLPVE